MTDKMSDAYERLLYPKTNRRDFMIAAGSTGLGLALFSSGIKTIASPNPADPLGWGSFFKKLTRFAEMIGMVLLGQSPTDYFRNIGNQVASDVKKNVKNLQSTGYQLSDIMYGNKNYPVIFVPMVKNVADGQGALVPVYNMGNLPSHAHSMMSVIGLTTMETYAAEAPPVSGLPPAQHMMVMDDVADDLKTSKNYNPTQLFQSLLSAGSPKTRNTANGFVHVHKTLDGAVRSTFNSTQGMSGDIRVEVLRKQSGSTNYSVTMNNLYNLKVEA
jgi:hypothetical protein